MTNDDIKAYFDGSNITLAELSAMTGKTVKQLKAILMGWKHSKTIDYWRGQKAETLLAGV